MMDDYGFLSQADSQLADEYVANGYIVGNIEDQSSFVGIQKKIATYAASILDLEIGVAASAFLNDIHTKLDATQLNTFRLKVMERIHSDLSFNAQYFALAQQLLYSIVGNELVMQKRINLSIQLPDDQSSLLPIHADTWSGDSPFEAVLWVPLVDCFNTKSMFILPPSKMPEVDQFFRAEGGNLNSEDLFRQIESDLVWLNVKAGECVLFNQTLPHGNRVNKEIETRWSLNCRFKSLFSPYSDKKLGEFFEPITVKPASIVGLDYEFPGA